MAGYRKTSARHRQWSHRRRHGERRDRASRERTGSTVSPGSRGVRSRRRGSSDGLQPVVCAVRTAAMRSPDSETPVQRARALRHEASRGPGVGEPETVLFQAGGGDSRDGRCGRNALMVATAVAGFGRITLWIVGEMDRMMVFLLSTIAWMLRPPFRLLQVLKQIHFIGVKSLFVILLTGAFTGMVLGLQGYYSLRKFGAEGLLGSAVALSIIRELGPVLSALMVTGRAGSAMTAEIGIMRITEQIDALDTMAVNPMQYLIAPKVLASVLVMPLLCSIFDLIGIYGGYLVGVDLLGVSSGAYTSSMESSVEWKDVYGGYLKALSFGVIVSWVCTYKGYNTTMSAEGLGTATTEAVVLSSVLILIWDYFVTSVLM